MNLVIFGCGYSGLACARLAQAQGAQVIATCRSESRQKTLLGAGVEARLFDGTAPLADARAILQTATHILVSVPPDGDRGDPLLAHHAGDIAAAAPYAWIGYLSTTGVYGNRNGAWVDEDTPPAPSGLRGHLRLAAEAGWQALADAGPVHIFRLAGIYGPGRNMLETIRAGRARRIDKPGQYFGRIHLADIARILDVSMRRPAPLPGRIYNVSDDEPAAPRLVVEYGCRLLGVLPPPLIPLEDAHLSAMARSFYRDNKRVSNRRVKRELGMRLCYPDYRCGLAALLPETSPRS